MIVTASIPKVAIIGCGLIGAQWDDKASLLAPSLTHAAGFSKHPRVQLVAVCDHDSEKARIAAQRWHVPTFYCEPRALFIENQIDIVVVATHTASRWDVIEPALAARVKVVVLEKPIAATLDECRKIVAALNAAEVKSIINFSRRWDPSMDILRKRISEGRMGRLQRIVGIYGKGITNNGSHMIDLCMLLCDAKPVRARALGSPLNATEAVWNQGKDRAWDAQIEFRLKDGSCIQLTMLGTDQSAYSCFELRIIGNLAICDISKGGRNIVYREIEDDPNYAGYRVPGDGVSEPAHALEAMDWMVDEAVRLATGESSSSSCDAMSALLTALTIDAIERSVYNQGAWELLYY